MEGRNTIVEFVILMNLLAGVSLVRSQMNDKASLPRYQGLSWTRLAR